MVVVVVVALCCFADFDAALLVVVLCGRCCVLISMPLWRWLCVVVVVCWGRCSCCVVVAALVRRLFLPLYPSTFLSSRGSRWSRCGYCGSRCCRHPRRLWCIKVSLQPVSRCLCSYHPSSSRLALKATLVAILTMTAFLPIFVCSISIPILTMDGNANPLLNVSPQTASCCTSCRVSSAFVLPLYLVPTLPVSHPCACFIPNHENTTCSAPKT